MISFPTPDHQRMYHLYRYLFTCLAMTRKKDGSPNYTAISDRLSDRNDFRKIISELLNHTHLTDEVERPIKWGTIPQSTTGDVVAMLARLQAHLQKDYEEYDPQTPYTRILTQDDLLLVLQKLIELTPDERTQLGVQSSDTLTLLQRTFLSLQQSDGSVNHDVAFRLYHSAVGLGSDTGELFRTLEQVDQHIETVVDQALQYLPNRQRNQGEMQSYSTATIKKTLTQKAQREMRRLLARSGNGRQPIGYRLDAIEAGPINMEAYIQHYLNRAFVTKLAQTVVANERLTNQFPVYLKRITIQPLGPLPFADKRLGILSEDAHYRDLLHPALQRLDQNHQGELPSPGDYELASQDASEVCLDFYVKVPAGYQPSVERVFRQLASQNGDRIDFSVSSSGIGGTLSHAVKIINTALLADMPCLQDYFDIAHDVTSTQEIIQDNVPSPVWSHNLVKLCHKQTVAQALVACQRDRLRTYEEFAFAEPIGQGDYCGFDFFPAQAHAALQARLQAIRHTGVNPRDYLHQLCHHTEQTIALKDAWSYFKRYPFSTLAMVGVLETEILGPMLGDRPLNPNDPFICFDACLSIIEALLDEGGYRPARPYLERVAILNEFVQQGMAIANPTTTPSAQPFTIFSGKLLVRYLICLAHYYYLYDTSDGDSRYLPPHCHTDVNREILVQRSWRFLDQAQTHIQVRLRKYVIIQEVSQSTFHPHYALLSRVAFLRAKLLLFFSRFVPRQDTLSTDRFIGQQRNLAATHWGQLYLTEKARLYAAADGDSELYTCYASMQCWLHLMAAYADPKDLYLDGNASPTGQILAPKQCMEWAKTLRDHALISYAPIGRTCYYQIKEKSGLPHRSTFPEQFGRFKIDRLPAIYEARGHHYTRLYNQFRRSQDTAWVWDMSLLVVSASDLPKLSPSHPNHPIYLFGTNACYLFFARGMYLLCGDEFTEFNPSQPDSEQSSDPLETLTSRESNADSNPAVARWEKKLNHAMRLLNMAWAIAEEGGKLREDDDAALENTTRENAAIENATTNDATVPSGYEGRKLTVRSLRITRSIEQGDRPNEYFSPEVSSVRELYPRRVTEIADLGKVFSLVCMVLRLYTVTPEQREALVADIKTLLNTLHDAYHLTELSHQLLEDQRRYNGHLEPHLQRIKQLLLAAVERAEAEDYALSTTVNAGENGTMPRDAEAIAHQRYTLLRDIFAAILNHSDG